jgi:hypothetical protein
MQKIIYPGYFQIYRRDLDHWYQRNGKVFYNPSVQSIDQNQAREAAFGLSVDQILLEFCLLNGGKPGYYLANLRDRAYYYCGEQWADVQTQLHVLGIGRPEPCQD